jgi:undecaprenyl-diphosphatase
MGIVEAVLYGVLQGITEFLPISSSGHLVLAHSLFGESGGSDLAFDAILHLATAAAVVIYFRKDIGELINTALRKLGRLPVNEKDVVLLSALLVGTVPAVILGLFLESLMESAFRSPLLVALVLVAGSMLFIYAEWIYLNQHRDSEITIKKGFKIGLFQALALVPGVSRSGASIAGGMLLGLTRSDAAKFAFLLAIPVMFGAGGKKLLELLTSNEPVAWISVAAGASAAFFTGLLAIHFMLSFVRKHTLWPFIWYRIFLAFFVLFVYYFG